MIKILVCSCDKNEDLWVPFHHCIEKYWKDHPEIIYLTETKENYFYKTIFKNYPINQWTRRVREAVEEIDAENILIMCDDIFIDKYVNTDNFNELIDNLHHYDLASINMQISNNIEWPSLDKNIVLMSSNAKYKTSVMCNLWDKHKLLNVICDNLDPWSFEEKNNHKNYKYCRLKNAVLHWEGVVGGGVLFGIYRGKWIKSTAKFLEDEGLNIDYLIRGYYDKC